MESLNTPELQRLALVIGAIVAINYKNAYGIIPGGVIIPGVLIVSFLISPIWCFTTIALSFFIYWLYSRFFKKADYKRRTPMYVLSALSLGIAHSLSLAYSELGFMTPTLDSFSGALVPAIIAFTWTRQKMELVFRAIILTTLISAAILGMIYVIGTNALGLEFDTIADMIRGKNTLGLRYPLFQFYVMVGVGYWIYRRINIRSGGYIIAPAAAALLVNPVSAVLFLMGCIAVYFATKAICDASLIVGLNRYALALCLSTIFVWGVELVFLQLDSTILPFQGSSVLVIIAMLSFVNDSILYGHKNVYRYIGVMLLIAIALAFVSEAMARLVI
jgi:hypothetical protein